MSMISIPWGFNTLSHLWIALAKIGNLINASPLEISNSNLYKLFAKFVLLYLIYIFYLYYYIIIIILYFYIFNFFYIIFYIRNFNSNTTYPFQPIASPSQRKQTKSVFSCLNILESPSTVSQIS